MSKVYLYIIDTSKCVRKASCALYNNPRRVRMFYECIRAALPASVDIALMETKDGFRIEVYL